MTTPFGDHITFLLRAAVTSAARCAPDERTRRTFGVLVSLDGSRELAQGELAEQLCINRTIMVKVVDELEAGGLVTRVRGVRDRRRYALRMTSEGKAHKARLAPEMDICEECVTSALSETQRRRLLALLRTVASSDTMPDDLAKRVTFQLVQAHHRALLGTIDALATVSLFPRHYGALAAVRESPHCSQLDVATKFGVSEPVAAEVVSDLEGAGC